MGDDAERSRGRDDTDRGRHAQLPTEQWADCREPASERTEERPTVDGLYQLCADRDRRHALYYLAESDGAVPIGELVARLAERSSACGGTTRPAAEAGGGVPSSDGDSNALESTSETVLTSLHHVHLPKLADAGAASYDREAGEVVPSIDERLSAVLEVARDLECSGEIGGTLTGAAGSPRPDIDADR